MAKAMWNGVVLAESDKTVRVEGNHYFPLESLNQEYFAESTTQTRCPWKGKASYYTIEVDGQTNRDATWYYDSPQTFGETNRPSCRLLARRDNRRLTTRRSSLHTLAPDPKIQRPAQMNRSF